jgi:hypothetical protein
MEPPQRGHTRGSSSKMRRRSSVQRRLRARTSGSAGRCAAGGSGAWSAWGPPGRWPGGHGRGGLGQHMRSSGRVRRPAAARGSRAGAVTRGVCARACRRCSGRPSPCFRPGAP